VSYSPSYYLVLPQPLDTVGTVLLVDGVDGAHRASTGGEHIPQALGCLRTHLAPSPYSKRFIIGVSPITSDYYLGE